MFAGLCTFPQHHRSKRPLLPFRVGNPHHACFPHRRVSHQRIFQVHGTNPLAAGFHQVLGTIYHLHDSVLVNRPHVSGPEPSVVTPLESLVRRFVVLSSHPRASDFHFPRRFAVPRSLTFRPHHADLNEWHRPSLFRADRIFFF